LWHTGGWYYGSGDSWSVGSGIGSYYGAAEDGAFCSRPPYNALRSSRELLVNKWTLFEAVSVLFKSVTFKKNSLNNSIPVYYRD